MKFRTECMVPKGDFILPPYSPISLLGSCFADNIRGRMKSALWDAVNPFGTLYHPLAIAGVVESVLSPGFEDIARESIFQRQNKWMSWLVDSRFARNTPQEVISALLEAAQTFLKTIREGSLLMVTFGSSYGYYLRPEAPGAVLVDMPVGNCHKMSDKLFERRRDSVETMAAPWQRILKLLADLNPNLKVVFTVSPVRHLRDGMTANAISKGRLLELAEHLSAEFDNAAYFPAYEILMDDLRDYRFYADDLLHPSAVAVDYIWDKFKEYCMDKTGIEALNEGERLRRRLEHRPLLPGDTLPPDFVATTNALLADFRRRY